MLPYNNLIHLDRKAATPVYLQLTNELVKLIQNGQLSASAKLPSSRTFAELFQLNRNTVTKSLEELEALGWVIIKPKKGTFVVNTFPIVKPNSWTKKGEVSNLETTKQFEFYDFPHLKLPRAFNPNFGFDDGLPDVRLAPIDELARGYARNVRQLAFENDLSYKKGFGNLDLRQQLVKMLNETRGLNIKVDNILITRGTIMAIHLAAAASIRKGDKVIIGETNYQTANMVVEHLGGELVRVPVDKKGIQVAKIREICKKQAIRAIYVTSHHHHPTTVTLSPERRLQLLEMAKAYNFVILEDDYDYDFHFGNSPVLPLASGDVKDRVLYFGSFTKIIAPAFRVGYLVGPARLIRELPKLRRTFDRQGDNVLEKTIADLIIDGTIRRHLKKSWRHYKERRDFFCMLLKRELGDLVEFQQPTGGMAVWVKFDNRISIPQVSKQLMQKGIFFSDGSNYNPPHQDLNSVRMGFAAMNLEEIERCIGVLKEVILESN
ncbi:MAG: PLP-dependent aminotransferase family protein [Saprospiraceae bacterium]